MPQFVELFPQRQLGGSEELPEAEFEQEPFEVIENPDAQVWQTLFW